MPAVCVLRVSVLGAVQAPLCTWYMVGSRGPYTEYEEEGSPSKNSLGGAAKKILKGK